MRHKIDSPQYHPIRFKRLKPRTKPGTEPKQEWRGGAKIERRR